ncbi:hypothetical protein PaG_02333 [Moesziomyces aphidis]|uniref:Uncharacterized protein n=1 Tax=Moesziomyces aphidis TaxID=84754 RepID=W3VT67_MOEAP|nr:hypothetical protein PaG_02333 [Moesziomyces aphidis]
MRTHGGTSSGTSGGSGREREKTAQKCLRTRALVGFKTGVKGALGCAGPLQGLSGGGGREERERGGAEGRKRVGLKAGKDSGPPPRSSEPDAVSTSPSDVQQTPRIFPLWAACITHPLPVAAGGPAGQVDVASFFSLPCDASPALRPAWMRFNIGQGVVRHLVSPADGMERPPYLAFFSDDTPSTSYVGTSSPP